MMYLKMMRVSIAYVKTTDNSTPSATDSRLGNTLHVIDELRQTGAWCAVKSLA